MLLKELDSALHAERGLLHNTQRIAQRLSSPAPPPAILDNNNIIKPMAANLRHLRATVLETALIAHVDQDVCRQLPHIIAKATLPLLCPAPAKMTFPRRPFAAVDAGA